VRRDFAFIENLYREIHYRKALRPLLTAFWEAREALHDEAVSRNILPEWAGSYPDKQLMIQHFDRINDAVDVLGGSVDSFIQRPLTRMAFQIEALEKVCNKVNRLHFWTSAARQLHLFILGATITSLVIAVVGVIALSLSEPHIMPSWIVSTVIAIPYAFTIGTLFSLGLSELGLHAVEDLVGNVDGKPRTGD